MRLRATLLLAATLLAVAWPSYGVTVRSLQGFYRPLSPTKVGFDLSILFPGRIYHLDLNLTGSFHRDTLLQVTYPGIGIAPVVVSSTYTFAQSTLQLPGEVYSSGAPFTLELVSGGDAFVKTATVIAVVPESGTALLLMTSLVGVAAHRPRARVTIRRSLAPRA